MNVINVGTLERELANLAVYANHPAAQSWVNTVARNFLLNGLTDKDIDANFVPYASPKPGKRHSDLPDFERLPEWAKNAIKNHVSIHWFNDVQVRRRPLWQSLEYIIHWFNAWPANDRRWNRVSRIDFRTAASASAMWFKDVTDNLWDYVKDKPPVIKVYENGYHWIRMSTALHFERESRLMGHCVSNGSYYESYRRGSHEYYSLRDKYNRPHVTVEVTYTRTQPPTALIGFPGSPRKAGSVMQCKGKSNAKPAPEYQLYIRRFFNDMKWEITGDLNHID